MQKFWKVPFLVPLSWTLHFTMSNRSIFPMGVTCSITPIVKRALWLHCGQWISKHLKRAPQQVGRGLTASRVVEAPFNGRTWEKKFLGEIFQPWTSNSESNISAARAEHWTSCYRQKNSGIRLKIWTSQILHPCPTLQSNAHPSLSSYY